MKRILVLLFLFLSHSAFACGFNIMSEDLSSINFLTSTGLTKTVITLKEICDNSSGYILTISSTHGGNFVGINGSYAYQITYGGEGPVSLSQNFVKNYTSASSEDIKTLQLVFPAYPNAVAGNYSDSITLSISTP